MSTAMRNAPRQLQRTRLQCHAAPVRLCEPAAASASRAALQRQQQGEEKTEDGEDEGAAMDVHDEETFDDNDFYTQVCATSLLHLLYSCPIAVRRLERVCHLLGRVARTVARRETARDIDAKQISSQDASGGFSWRAPACARGLSLRRILCRACVTSITCSTQVQLASVGTRAERCRPRVVALPHSC